MFASCMRDATCVTSSWFYFDDQGFRGEKSRFVGQVYSPWRGTTGFLARIKTELDEAQQEEFKDHVTAPFCWLELPDGRKKIQGWSRPAL